MIRSILGGLALLTFVFAPCTKAQEADTSWNSLLTQGQRALSSNDYTGAEQLLQKALREAQRFAANDWRVGVTEAVLGETLIAEKKFSEADTALNHAIGIVVDGDDPVQVANVNFDIARLRIEQDKPAEAVGFARNALATYQASQGGNSAHTAAALCLLGDALRLKKAFTDAEEPLRRCADLRESDGGIDSPDFADALYSLALVYAGEGKYTLAEPRFKLAEQIRENKFGLMSPVVAQTMEEHAALLKTMGRDKDAEKLMALVAAIRRNDKSGKKNAR